MDRKNQVWEGVVMEDDFAFRVAAQYLVLAAVRTAVNNRKYGKHGQPNIQSAMDIMLIPSMDVLREQLRNTPYFPSLEMIQRVKEEWGRQFDPTRFLMGKHVPIVEDGQ